jgi:hypothetical protein
MKKEKNENAAQGAVGVAALEKELSQAPRKRNTKPPKPKGAHSKESYLKAKAYKWKVDLINALLDDDKYYTKAEVDALIDNYLKSEVK